MYVAARGGEGAIQNAERLYRELIGHFDAETVRTIERAMPYLIDRVMGEGSLYAPELAALALAQSGGDLYEAVLMLRAFRSTQPRLAYARVVDAERMLVVRRISAAFKDIPGGQVLGPTLDYSHRVLDLAVLEGEPTTQPRGHEELEKDEPFESLYLRGEKNHLPLVADWQRDAGLLPMLPVHPCQEATEIPDVTREPLLFPAPRAMRLQSLSRADTGGVLALGYANMRGYGAVHPTVNEVRLGYADVEIVHPITGEPFSIGRVRVTHAEVVTAVEAAPAGNDASAGEPAKLQLALGFCATVGWNEVKTIAGAMLDMAMDLPDPHPSHTEEYVLYHTDPVESSGFCIHYKLPHYVTFGSELDVVRSVGAAKKVSGLGDYYGDGSGLAAGMPGVYSERATPPVSEAAGEQV
ncbi:MAG: carbon-phosphorus lyase complex subunit PhnI [Anaerolineae bacterium]|nr:carbon-phosphorus lyase complex subunit PhnI [Candidatus Roseilinea sp.]MDW8450604.1 carbon-phosphorus lyase complex subunit PhnI [Anaerolineae bacterium]